jgi:C-terminal processing protease CtpA/Prc
VVSLLAQQTFNGYMEAVHADRAWIGAYVNASNWVQNNYPNDPMVAEFQNRANQVDQAYSANQTLSVPLPMFFESTTIAADPGHWTKPVMVLADELSVSCADIVPLLVKANGIGTVFGQTTMGGGGNVEEVATLPNTQAKLSISRGIGTVFDPTGAYPESNIIEDNGVSPDVAYSHTLADFRAGFVGYVKAFNSALAAKLP